MKSNQTRRYRFRLIASSALFTLLLFCHSETTFAQWVTNGANMSNTNTGNVGIGTSAPAAGLDVLNSAPAGTGTARFKNLTANTQVIIDSASSQNANLRFDNNTLPSWYVGNDASNNRFRFINGNSNGNVEMFSILQDGSIGIGTSAPKKKLHLFGANSQLFIDRPSNGAGNYALVNFATGGMQKFFMGLNADAGAGVDKLSIFDSAISATNPVMTFSGGNVGIGTATPTSKLHVAGDGNITGNLTVGGNLAAKYQDVAEWVDSSQALEPGTVVVLDHSKSNHVIASTQIYDSAVAGVVSCRPGLALGDAGDGRVLVAATGRVKVKVDATNGPIAIGDLLVTSDVPGVAMKSVPVEIGGVQIHRPGTLIGKALEPLTNGRGEILVLLSLQ